MLYDCKFCGAKAEIRQSGPYFGVTADHAKDCWAKASIFLEEIDPAVPVATGEWNGVMDPNPPSRFALENARLIAEAKKHLSEDLLKTLAANISFAETAIEVLSGNLRAAGYTPERAERWARDERKRLAER